MGVPYTINSEKVEGDEDSGGFLSLTDTAAPYSVNLCTPHLSIVGANGATCHLLPATI